MFGLKFGNFHDMLTRNPLEYGDAFGLTRGPLSGRAPGKLTDTGLDWQAKVNPGISRTALSSANDIAPWIAGAVAGGSALGLGGAGGEGAATSMPAAVPESAGTLSNRGMTQTAPGEYTATQAPAAGGSPWASAMKRSMLMNQMHGGGGGHG